MRTFFSLLLAAVLFIGCSESMVTEPTIDDVPQLKSMTDQATIAAKKGDNIQICHFPPGNIDHPQLISVNATAAKRHISVHLGQPVLDEKGNETGTFNGMDGYAGDPDKMYEYKIVYDLNCKPIKQKKGGGRKGKTAEMVAK